MALNLASNSERKKRLGREHVSVALFDKAKK